MWRQQQNIIYGAYDIMRRALYFNIMDYYEDETCGQNAVRISKITRDESERMLDS